MSNSKFLALLISGTLLTSSVRADEGRILDKMDAKTTITADKAPLTEVIDFLKDLHGIPIVIDEQALADINLQPDVEIEAKTKELPLQEVLKRKLDKLALSWMIRDDTLVITSRVVTLRNPRTAIYTLDPLLTKDSDRRELESVARSLIGASADKGHHLHANAFRTNLIVSATEEGHAKLNAVLRELVAISQEKSAAQDRLPRPKTRTRATLGDTRETRRTGNIPASRKSLEADPFGLRETKDR